MNQLIQIGDAVGEPFPYEPQRESAAAMQIAVALSRGTERFCRALVSNSSRL